MFISNRLYALLSIFILFSISTSFAQDPECTAYQANDILSDQPSVECASSDVLDDDSEYPVRIFLGGLASAQMTNPTQPISLWNLEVEFHPFWEEFQVNLSVDNPALGKGFPSAIIQPAHTAYRISLAVENIKIGNVDGIRISIFHVSDHEIEALTSFDNNQFNPQYDGGFADIATIQRMFWQKTNVGSGYIRSAGNYNLIRYFDIPGYLMTEVGTQGIFVRADQKFTFQLGHASSGLGKALGGTYQTKIGGSYFWDIKSEEVVFPSNTQTRSTISFYPDGDLALGYVDISKTVRMGNMTGKIHLTSAGQIPLENLNVDTSLVRENNQLHFYPARMTGYVTLGLEFLPFTLKSKK